MNKMGKKPYSELNVAITMKAVFANRNWNYKLSPLFQGGKWRSKDEL